MYAKTSFVCWDGLRLVFPYETLATRRAHSDEHAPWWPLVMLHLACPHFSLSHLGTDYVQFYREHLQTSPDHYAPEYPCPIEGCDKVYATSGTLKYAHKTPTEVCMLTVVLIRRHLETSPAHVSQQFTCTIEGCDKVYLSHNALRYRSLPSCILIFLR